MLTCAGFQSSRCEAFTREPRCSRAIEVTIAQKVRQLFGRDLDGIRRFSFLNSIPRDSLPEFLRLVKLDQRPSKILRLIGNQNIFPVSQGHSFCAD